MRQRLMRFMQGRYGADDLSRVLFWVILFILVLSLFTTNILWWIGLLLIVYTYFRMFSKNIPARYAENQKFLQFKEKIMVFFRRRTKNMGQLKKYHIYKCPNCKQKIRIPRGKGRIEITCPKCKRVFIKRS